MNLISKGDGLTPISLFRIKDLYQRFLSIGQGTPYSSTATVSTKFLYLCLVVSFKLASTLYLLYFYIHMLRLNDHTCKIECITNGMYDGGKSSIGDPATRGGPTVLGETNGCKGFDHPLTQDPVFALIIKILVPL